MPKLIVINPLVSFGQPVLEGTGVPTSILAQRYAAGDSIYDLAEDYDCDRLKVEEAIRYEHIKCIRFSNDDSYRLTNSLIALEIKFSLKEHQHSGTCKSFPLYRLLL